jgi:uncharacterized protein YbjT (DUF2867 family)
MIFSPKKENEMNILILGAGGQIASFAIPLFLERTDAHLTLYLRDAQRLQKLKSDRVRVIEGDVLDLKQLKEAMAKQDVVYANLSGQLEKQARNIVQTMNSARVKRVIFISSMGIYDEIPGEKHGSVLEPYIQSAAIIEASGLDYTLIRPEWLNNKNEIDYEITQKGEPFKNPKALVSRKSVADLVVKLTQSTGVELGRSLGVNKP